MYFIQEYLLDVVYIIQYIICFDFFFPLENSKRRGKALVVTGVVLLETAGRLFLPDSYLKDLLMLMTVLIIVMYIAKIQWYHAVAVSVITALMLSMFNMLFSVFIRLLCITFGITLSMFWQNFLNIIFGIMFFLIANRATRKYVTTSARLSICIRNFLVFSLVVVLNLKFLDMAIGDMFFNTHDLDSVETNRFSWFYGLALLIELMFLWGLLVSQAKAEENAILAQMYLESQKGHYDYLEERERETRRFRHDLRNHILLLKELVDAGKDEEVKKYMGEMNETINSFGNRLSVGNEIVDAIINRYASEAMKNKIVVTTEGTLGTIPGVSAFDLCTIFSNLFDNALTASKKVNGRMIVCKIRNTEHEAMLSVTNEFDGKLQKAPGVVGLRLLTTKDDEINHGFGLENIRRAVEKNNGDMMIDAQGHQFTVTIALPRRIGMNDE